MDLTVRQHIDTLEIRLRNLNAEFMDETDSDRRNHLEAEIRAAESALSHFRSALELEKALTLKSP